MRLVDTHCHLDFPDYKNDLVSVVKRAEDDGIERMIVPGVSVKSTKDAIALTTEHKNIYAACGIHPHEADKVSEKDCLTIRKLALESDKVVAIGEIGLDYFKGYSDKKNQKRLFTHLLDIANDLDLPVIIHNRDASDDVLEILSKRNLRGVIHCFSGDEVFLEEVLKKGFYVSFAGYITFANSKNVRDIIRKVPPEALLLETDSPYITPEPLRGQRNEPCNVKYLLKVYADIYNLSERDIARITTHNANELFNLGLEEKPAISYAIRDSLYLNITNRCSNDCVFCTRQTSNFVKGHNLKLDKEPTYEEIIDSLKDVSNYKEVVFCGFGEPTLRFEMVKKVAAFLKEKNIRVRLTTNGTANLVEKRDVTPELEGLVDQVSISLNAPGPKEHYDLCKPEFGEKTYESMLEFISGCTKRGILVEVTCLDIIGEDKIDKCRSIAEDRGAVFRLRHFNVVG